MSYQSPPTPERFDTEPRDGHGKSDSATYSHTNSPLDSSAFTSGERGGGVSSRVPRGCSPGSHSSAHSSTWRGNVRGLRPYSVSHAWREPVSWRSNHQLYLLRPAGGEHPMQPIHSATAFGPLSRNPLSQNFQPSSEPRQTLIPSLFGLPFPSPRSGINWRTKGKGRPTAKYGCPASRFVLQLARVICPSSQTVLSTCLQFK
jgi:hypothetical protein